MTTSQTSPGERLSALVSKAGSYRKAEQLIRALRGAAPSKSSIDRATKGKATEYVTLCMIEDLEAALKNDQ
ncbi:hypothetical protein EHW58_11635 [Salinivibrio sp. VYel1]|nr:hypothetical protein [Salinivibrio sp. VYel1]